MPRSYQRQGPPVLRAASTRQRSVWTDERGDMPGVPTGAVCQMLPARSDQAATSFAPEKS